jgi:hypothetical protein
MVLTGTGGAVNFEITTRLEAKKMLKLEWQRAFAVNKENGAWCLFIVADFSVQKNIARRRFPWNRKRATDKRQ